jgi:predicted ATP-grasp superfamily ATP-dependent carboligase
MAGSRTGVTAPAPALRGEAAAPDGRAVVAVEWRPEHPVMVAEAQAVGSVGVIRSLGRAGYPVHAVSASREALGLRSRFATRSAVSPAYTAPDFIPWLRGYIRDFGIRAIVPSEGFLFAIRDTWSEFIHLMPIPADRQVVFRALSKYEFFERLAADVSLWRNVPPTLFVRDELPAESEYAKLPLPIFLKADRCHSRGSADGDIVRTVTPAEARRRTADLLRDYDRVLVQGFVPGTKPGEYLLRWDGQVRAHFANLMTHQSPHRGGFGSLRASWHHPEMARDAEEKLRAMDWQGAAMVEYRWDPATDRFWCIELNARFWGSLHHALYAGIDFPRLLVDAFLGRPPEPRVPYRDGLRCRLIVPAEVGYVQSRLRDPEVGLGARLWTVIEFFLLCFNPRIRSDLHFPGDRMLFWRAAGQFARSFFGRNRP